MTDRPTNQRPTDRPGHRAVKFQTTTKSLPRSSGSFVIFLFWINCGIAGFRFRSSVSSRCRPVNTCWPLACLVYVKSWPSSNIFSKKIKCYIHMYACIFEYRCKKTNVHSSPFITVRSSCLSASFKSKHTVRIIEKNGTSFPGRPCQRRTSNSCSRPWPWSLRESWPQGWLSSRSPAR